MIQGHRIWQAHLWTGVSFEDTERLTESEQVAASVLGAVRSPVPQSLGA